jgi:hypothetical protein
VGELFQGKWWGGLYGWRWPHGYHSVGQAIQIGAANAMLVAGGDPKYLAMPRSTLDKLISAGEMRKGTFVIPEQKDAEHWFAFREVDRSYMASIWFMSQRPDDWQRIESVRQRDRVDWNQVIDLHNKVDGGHDAPWLRFLAGANPEYPEKILSSARGQVAFRVDRMRNNWLLIDEYPGTWRQVDKDKTDFTLLNEHHWQGQNPVTTEALVQLMLGAPQVQYNGGLLYASVRYFDPVRRRPGVPPDVAALVRTIEAGRITLELYNLNLFERREVVLQAGAYGEHNFTTVKQGDGSAADVNQKYFSVRLEPGAGTTLEAGLRRWANRPTYAFPWHGDTVPVK